MASGFVTTIHRNMVIGVKRSQIDALVLMIIGVILIIYGYLKAVRQNHLVLLMKLQRLIMLLIMYIMPSLPAAPFEKSNLLNLIQEQGGAAGAYIFEIDLTEYVKQAGVNGKIILTAGKAGIGGNKSASNNTKASDGTAGNLSQIIIKKQNGDTVYGIRAKGGSGGKAAQNITAAGTAAINPNISSSRNCEYTTDGINWAKHPAQRIY